MSHVPQVPKRPDDEEAASRVWRTEAPPTDGSLPPPREPEPAERRREPALMLPGSVVAMVAIITIVQFARSMMTPQQDLLTQLWFAFIPARYADSFFPFPGGVYADVWTFVSYALLHGSWVHLITNAVWMVAFGSAVARRFGALRFWVFSAVAAAGGAGLHLALHFGDPIPVVGASAAIAGQMAAAARFVFDTGGPIVLRRPGDDSAFRRPARSLLDTFRNRSALLFIVVWFGINLAVGLGSSVSGGLAIAWEAHIGGFLVGLLMFRLFDPVPAR